MSNATKCDRCGACYEYGGMTVGEEYDLCDGCVADFEAWIEHQHVTGAPERVTNEGETLHDTGVSGYRYHIIRDGMMRMVVGGSDLKDTDVVESVEEPDTREKLEAEMAEYLEYDWYMLAPGLLEKMSGWLDRQAAITERETKLRELYRFEENHREHVRSIEAVNQELNAKLADAREALDAAWGEREELKAANDRLLVALDAIEGCDNRCKQIGTERDRWKDAFEDSERMRLALVDDLGKRDMGIERLKRRRGELMEQVRSLQDELARVRRNERSRRDRGEEHYRVSLEVPEVRLRGTLRARR